MSFGFSISDAFALGKLAWNTTQNSRKACGEHDGLTREVSTLYTVIRRLEQEVKKPESLINANGDNDIYKKELQALMVDCGKVLRVLDKILEKYNTLSEEERSKRKLWQRIRFGNGEMADLSDLRSKIVLYTSSITFYLNIISMGSVGRIEQEIQKSGGILREIQLAINGITTQFISRNSYEGSVFTNYADDDKAVWREFRRELRQDGFSSSIIQKHKHLILDYIKELGNRGLLDDQESPENIDEWHELEPGLQKDVTNSLSKPPSSNSVECAATQKAEVLVSAKGLFVTATQPIEYVDNESQQIEPGEVGAQQTKDDNPSAAQTSSACADGEPEEAEVSSVDSGSNQRTKDRERMHSTEAKSAYVQDVSSSDEDAESEKAVDADPASDMESKDNWKQFSPKAKYLIDPDGTIRQSPWSLRRLHRLKYKDASEAGPRSSEGSVDENPEASLGDTDSFGSADTDWNDLTASARIEAAAKTCVKSPTFGGSPANMRRPETKPLPRVPSNPGPTRGFSGKNNKYVFLADFSSSDTDTTAVAVYRFGRPCTTPSQTRAQRSKPRKDAVPLRSSIVLQTRSSEEDSDLEFPKVTSLRSRWTYIDRNDSDPEFSEAISLRTLKPFLWRNRMYRQVEGWLKKLEEVGHTKPASEGLESGPERIRKSSDTVEANKFRRDDQAFEPEATNVSTPSSRETVDTRLEAKGKQPETKMEWGNRAERQLESLAATFHLLWKPQCLDFIKHPPGDDKARWTRHKTLSENILTQIILKLDGLEIKEPVLKARRKQIIREVQTWLARIDRKR